MRAVSRIWVFLLQEQLLLKAKSDSTNFLSMRSGRRRVWHFKKKNGGVSLSLGNQYSFPDLCLPEPNWTAVNCPICCQDQPRGLQRILAKEGLLQGWGWVGRWRPKFRHPMGPGAAGDCPASWLHFESKAFHNPHPSCQSQHAQGPGPVWSGHFPLHTCCSEVLGFRKPLSMGQSPPKPQPAVWVFSLPQVIMAFWAFLQAPKGS